MLESLINSELEKVLTLLCANKLSLNIDKSNFVISIQFKENCPNRHVIYKQSDVDPGNFH